MAKPITPEEARRTSLSNINGTVIQVFNEFLSENLRYGVAEIYQKDIVEELCNHGIDRGKIFRDRMLDIEEFYRDAGWTVEYFKSSIGDSEDSKFVFRAKKK